MIILIVTYYFYHLIPGFDQFTFRFLLQFSCFSRSVSMQNATNAARFLAVEGQVLTYLREAMKVLLARNALATGEQISKNFSFLFHHCWGALLP